MARFQRGLSALLVAAAASAGFAVVPGMSARAGEPWAARKAAAGPKGTITVTVTGIEPGQGAVHVGLYDATTPFPKENAELETRVTKAAGSSVTVRFEKVPQGTYAIASYHDLNGNGKIDYRMGLMPVEPIAFSQGAKATFGPPSFADAAFTLGDAISINLAF